MMEKSSDGMSPLDGEGVVQYWKQSKIIDETRSRPGCCLLYKIAVICGSVQFVGGMLPQLLDIWKHTTQWRKAQQIQLFSVIGDRCR